MLLLLDLNDGAVLESPLDDVGLLAGALDELGAAEGGPELAEVLDLDEVPDVGERGADDGRLADGSGGRDGGHLDESCLGSWLAVVCEIVTRKKWNGYKVFCRWICNELSSPHHRGALFACSFQGSSTHVPYVDISPRSRHNGIGSIRESIQMITI